MSVEKYTPAEARKVVEGRLSNAAPVSEYGKMKEAHSQANIVETQEKLAKNLGLAPPMTGEMVQNSSDYQNYMDASLSGERMSKQGYFGGPVLPTAAQGGIPPYTDPLNSQTRWGIPTWREEMSEEAKKETQIQARSWCRWYYHNHPVVPTCMEIYAKYPFVGLDLQCPDPQIEEEYKSIFFDILEYEELLPNAALQYWMNGEAALLAQWDDQYKGWVEEQIIDSDDIDVVSLPGPMLNKEIFLWYPPPDLQQTLSNQDMNDIRYLAMMENYGDEILNWAEGYPSELPSDVFSLLRFRSDLGGNRGYPILMRAFYSLMMEEKLKQAMTAVADRLYTPFIVVKLGSKDLLAGGQPWLPTEAQMKKMQAHLEMIMISKYRLMVYHSGIEFENPFAGQTIPDLAADFDRITQEILNVFGISKELIMGGAKGTYASGALSAEIMMQQLSTTQQKWSRWWLMDRAKKVAEARGYYQLERKGMIYTKPMERVVEFDPLTRKKMVRERRKLMLPAIRMETMDWRDQETKARGLQELRRTFDIPISDQRLTSFFDTDLDVDVEREQWAEERRTQYETIQQLGAAAPMQRQPGGAGSMPGGGGPGRPGVHQPGRAPGGPPPAHGPEDNPSGMPATRPPASDEQRLDMPNMPNPQPVLTHYDPEKTESINYITVSPGNENNLRVSEFESKMASNKVSEKTDEEMDEMIRKSAKWKRDEKFAKSPYDEMAKGPGINRNRIFNKNGKQRGTLYFMNGNRMVMAPTK